MVQHDMKAFEKTFKEGLAALESLLDEDFSKIFNETNQEVREAVEAAPITEKHRVLQEHVENWADRLAALIKRAFERYTALALAISRFVEGEPIEWVEGQVRQFLEPRLGQPMIPNPSPGTPGMYPSFAVRVIGGQKAHKGIILWIAEACGDEREIFSNWLIKGTLTFELDDEAVDSWEAPAWLALDQDDQPLEGRLDAKRTVAEVGLIHFVLWINLEDAIERARLRATVDVAASTSPELEQLEIEQHKPGGKKGKEPIARFPSPPDLCWEEVSMAFVSDSEIQVRARGQIRKYRFDQIGFENKKNGKPNRLWLFLQAFAATGGDLSWQDLSSTGMNANQVQSNVKDLRKNLRIFMCIEGDPFYPYREVKAYKAKFTITGDADVLLDTGNDAPSSDLEKTYLEDINRRS